MIVRSDIIVKIKDYLHLLDSPLKPSEINIGWTSALQEKWKSYYQQVLEYLESGKSLTKKPEYTASIVRAYDFSGIMEGELLDKAIDIQCRLRELEKEEKRLKSKFNFKLVFRIILCIVFCALLITKFFFYDFWKVPQDGMYPTIPNSKRFICKRNPYKSISEIKRGDIIAFKAHWKDGKQYDFIWRIVGLPGDNISINGDHVVINGNTIEKRKIRDEGALVIYKEINGEAQYEVAYLKKRGSIDSIKKEYNVPDNHVFVLGDNRDNASDSRELGMIPFETIFAKKI